MLRRCQVYALLGVSALGLFGVIAQSAASIIYFDIADVYMSSQCTTLYDLDIDGDTTPDMSLSSGGIFEMSPPFPFIEYLWATPPGFSRVIGVGEGVSLLTNGNFIASVPPDSLEWISGTDLTIHLGILDINNPPPCGEDFSGLTGFIGLEFDISGNTHYGWLRATLNPTNGAAILRDYAYETTPGMGILAGQIPEPSTVLLLSLGGLGLFWRVASKRGRRRLLLADAPTMTPKDPL